MKMRTNLFNGRQTLNEIFRDNSRLQGAETNPINPFNRRQLFH